MVNRIQPPEIIPVIDLKDGFVVHAIAGKRDRYQPIKSELTTGSTPHEIAAAFAKLGFDRAYVADLDAIGGSRPDYESYEAIRKCGLSLWIDSGTTDLTQALALVEWGVEWGVERVVVGSESIASRADLAAIVESVGPEKTLFSVDMKNGIVLAANQDWSGKPADEMIAAAVSVGVEQLLLLDLGRVGIGSGPGTEEIVRRIRQEFDVSVFVGGGVRNRADLMKLAECGCAGCLISTALHRRELDLA